MKLMYNGGVYKIVIPKEIVKLLEWQKGDEIGFILNEKGEIAMRKVKK